MDGKFAAVRKARKEPLRAYLQGSWVKALASSPKRAKEGFLSLVFGDPPPCNSGIIGI